MPSRDQPARDSPVNRRATIREVARRARVTPSTVSRVLNRYERNFSVAPKVRARIVRAVAELGYKGDPVARAMRMGQTLMIGVHVPNFEAASAANISAVQYLCWRRGYEILLAIHRSQKDSETAIQRHLDRKVDGLLLVAPTQYLKPEGLIVELVRANFPVVSLGVWFNADLDFVDWDRKGAFGEMAKGLAARGCRRFVFFTDQRTRGADERAQGIRRVLPQDAELRVLSCEGRSPPAKDWTGNGLRDLFEKRWPHAVLCRSDVLAVAALQEAQRMGLRVPQELAVAGTSDTPFALAMKPALTGVRVDHDRLAELALNRLLDRISATRHGRRLPVEEHRIAGEILWRESTNIRMG